MHLLSYDIMCMGMYLCLCPCVSMYIITRFFFFADILNHPEVFIFLLKFVADAFFFGPMKLVDDVMLRKAVDC